MPTNEPSDVASGSPDEFNLLDVEFDLPELASGPTPRQLMERLTTAKPRADSLADDLARVRKLKQRPIAHEYAIGVLSRSQWVRYRRAIAWAPTQASSARSSGAPDWND